MYRIAAFLSVALCLASAAAAEDAPPPRDAKPKDAYWGLHAASSAEKTKAAARSSAGAVVSSIDSDSPASGAGLRTGDVILSVNRSRIATASDLDRAIAKSKPGEEVNLTIRRVVPAQGDGFSLVGGGWTQLTCKLTVAAQKSGQPGKNEGSLWRDSRKGDVGTLGGRIAARTGNLPFKFHVLRIPTKDTADIYSEVEANLTQEEMKEQGPFHSIGTIEWKFRLKSKAVETLHEEQTLAVIPGRFVHLGRITDNGHTFDEIGDAPADAQPASTPEKAVGPKEREKRLAEERADLKGELEKVKGADEPPAVKRIHRESRTWTDASGKHTIDATFYSRIGDTVTLQKSDGQKIKLPLNKLSDEDREWLRKNGL